MGIKKSKMLHISNRIWDQIHFILRDNQGIRYFVISIVLLLATGFSVLAWMWQQPIAQLPTYYATTIPKPVPKIYSPLTGLQVADEVTASRHVTAVMIENSPDSRPQSGLKDAGVIYEAIAEGGITRFLALYQESRPGLVGPVRSVRPYYVEWGAAYDAAVAHIGGSAKALDMIRSGTYGVDLDQFFNAGTYWRADDRAAPHNVYTNFDRLDALSSSKAKSSSSYTAIERKDEEKAKTPLVTQINFPISSSKYAVDYEYQAETNSYIRKLGGEPHLDREAGQIVPKVVIAIQVTMTRQLEDGYRENIITTGTGRAFVFQDGTITEGTWHRADAKNQLSFTDQTGKPIALNRGQTWITALPNSKVPSWQ